jgi:hypothetical protein
MAWRGSWMVKRVETDETNETGETPKKVGLPKDLRLQ